MRTCLLRHRSRFHRMPTWGIEPGLPEPSRHSGPAAFGHQKLWSFVSRIWSGQERELCEERDHAEEWADRLALAIAVHLDEDPGEHSNLNNPWANA